MHMLKLKLLTRRGGKEYATDGLTELDATFRKIGGFGATWGHKWKDGKNGALVKTGMPFDESKRVFCLKNIRNGSLFGVVMIVFGECKEAEEKLEMKCWKELVNWSHSTS